MRLAFTDLEPFMFCMLRRVGGRLQVGDVKVAGLVVLHQAVGALVDHEVELVDGRRAAEVLLVGLHRDVLALLDLVEHEGPRADRRHVGLRVSRLLAGILLQMCSGRIGT